MYSNLFKIDDDEIYNIFYSFFKEHKEHSDWRFNCKIDKKLGNIIFEAEMSRDRIKGGIKFDVVENYNDTNPTYSKDIQQRQHQGLVQMANLLLEWIELYEENPEEALRKD